MVEEVESLISLTDQDFDLKDPRFYVNRELSMLEFQRRVLEEAQDDSNPLPRIF